MRTVANLIKELEKFPKDARCYAYEGEDTGIVIATKDYKYGFIHSSERGKIKKTEKIK